MRMKNIKIFLILAIIFVFCLPQASIQGQGAGLDDNSASMINREIKQLNDGIQGTKSQVKKLQNEQGKYSKAIKQKQAEKSSLNNQLAILDNRVAKAELDIEIVKADIEQTKLIIQKTDKEIEQKENEVIKEKEHITNILQLLYKKDNTTSLEIMLMNSSLADFLSQIKYLEDLNENVKKGLDNIEKYKRELEGEKKDLENEKGKFEKLEISLEDNHKKLESEKETKLYVLDQVSTSEVQYQKLLQEAKKEQEAAAAEIASMEKLVRAKISELEGNKLGFNDAGFAWPVPKNTITAYFHDPDYPFRHIFEHPAIDIRAGQGTPLRAAASGYVARVKNGGVSGYSYIMLIHGDGLSTVYGHVSKMFIQEDEYVVQGQIIGQTGGMPGTSGAGRLTTGPHLHFEVRLNGIPVDPLSYLP